jgi:hypothetical protein
MSEQRALFFVRKGVNHSLHFARKAVISLTMFDGPLGDLPNGAHGLTRIPTSNALLAKTFGVWTRPPISKHRLAPDEMSCWCAGYKHIGKVHEGFCCQRTPAAPSI